MRPFYSREHTIHPRRQIYWHANDVISLSSGLKRPRSNKTRIISLIFYSRYTNENRIFQVTLIMKLTGTRFVLLLKKSILFCLFLCLISRLLLLSFLKFISTLIVLLQSFCLLHFLFAECKLSDTRGVEKICAMNQYNVKRGLQGISFVELHITCRLLIVTSSSAPGLISW